MLAALTLTALGTLQPAAPVPTALDPDCVKKSEPIQPRRRAPQGAVKRKPGPKFFKPRAKVEEPPPCEDVAPPPPVTSLAPPDEPEAPFTPAPDVPDVPFVADAPPTPLVPPLEDVPEPCRCFAGGTWGPHGGGGGGGGFYLTPIPFVPQGPLPAIPEPSTYALLLVGLLGVAGWRAAGRAC